MKHYLVSTALIASIALIGGISLVQTNTQSVMPDGFEDGATQLAFEDAFDEALIVRSTAIKGWNAVRYAVFSETLPGAVSGHDHWLFSDEEYQVVPANDQKLDDSLAIVVAQSQRLEAMGASVIVALLPDKARIATTKVKRQRPEAVAQRYDAAVASLQAAGLRVVDPRQALLDAQAEAPVFMERDTHWTPFGARVVAEAVAPLISDVTGQNTQFETVLAKTEEHIGDLITFADAGALNATIGLGPQEVAIFETTQANSGAGDLSAGLFGDVSIPVTLVGTSYSAIPTWNFAGFLMQASSTDLLNRSLEGQGPFAPMTVYLDELDGGAAVPDVVVWEIPERYLTVDPEQ